MERRWGEAHLVLDIYRCELPVRVVREVYAYVCIHTTYTLTLLLLLRIVVLSTVDCRLSIAVVPSGHATTTIPITTPVYF